MQPIRGRSLSNPERPTAPKPQQQKQQQQQSVQSLQQHTVTVPKAATALQWLDLDSDTDQAFFEASTTPRSMAHDNADESDFYTLTEERFEEIGAAAEELHHMFEEATARVLEDDTLLQSFQIPAELQDKVKHSFASHRAGAGHHAIMGRLDLAMDDHEVKAYEYNADSASCLYECGYTQGRWADAVGLEGTNPGQDMARELEAAWRNAGIPATARLHLMLDDDLEEEYHARYVRDAARSAGIQTTLIKGVQGLSRGPNGEVQDAEGHAVQFVWKSWAWETVIDEFLTLGQQPITERAVSLSDVLLSDDITVWEPLWTVITANKAILPVLWEMYPNHPHLLRAEFELTEGLRTHPAGYVAKPIVGRCGSNVTMVQGDAVVASIGGKFAAKDIVHQEMRALPRMNGKSVLVCPWVVSGKMAGLVLRVDQGLITTTDSPIECLRIVPSQQPAAASA